MCLGVALDHAHTIGTPDPIESNISEDYLRVAQEEQDLVRELSTPPDSDADGIAIIKRYQSSWKDGVQNLTFTIES
jgi:hypothetical protein